MTDIQRISSMIQRLSGRAQDWAAVVWKHGGAETQNYARAGSSCFASGREQSLQQIFPSASASCDKSASSSATFSSRHKELACQDVELDVNSTITLAIKLDQHLRSQRQASPPPATGAVRERAQQYRFSQTRLRRK